MTFKVTRRARFTPDFLTPFFYETHSCRILLIIATYPTLQKSGLSNDASGWFT